MKRILSCIFNYFKQSIYIIRVTYSKRFKLDRCRSNIIRLTHSIEKGLSLRNSRPGFGYEKIIEIYRNLDDALVLDTGFINDLSVLIAIDAISEYLTWNDSLGCNSNHVSEIKSRFEEYNRIINRHNEKCGGTIRPQKLDVDVQSCINLFKNRHSTRTFLDKEIDKKILLSAINLAMRSPSACNRQSTRLYVVNHKYREDILGSWLSGTGGFDNEIKEYVLVCSKVSAYMPQEYQQYEVSSGIFVGYLTLAFELYGIGCCVIQRDVINTKAWRRVAEKMNVPFDEQIICILGCGIKDENYPVPLSYRFDAEEVTKFID